MKITIPVPKLSRATPRRTWSWPVLPGLVLVSVLAMPVAAGAHGRSCAHHGHHHGPCPGPVVVAWDPWLTEVVTWYGYQPVVVERYVRAGWSPEEIAVAVFLANRSGVSIDLVFEWRRGGRDWYDVADRCRVSPVVFITPLASPYDACGIFARPYTSWSRHPRGGWRFSDAEARELVYLRFAHERYGCEPRWVMHERSRGTAWAALRAAWRDHRDDSRGNHDGDRWNARSNDDHRDRDARWRDRDRDRDRSRDRERYAERNGSQARNVKKAKGRG